MARASSDGTEKHGARLTDRQRLAWLRLIRTENVGPSTFRTLVNEFGGAEAALLALPDLSRRGGLRKTIRIYPEDDAAAELRAAERGGASLVAMGERGTRPHSLMSMRRLPSST